jgi:hypothetical protein
VGLTDHVFTQELADSMTCKLERVHALNGLRKDAEASRTAALRELYRHREALGRLAEQASPSIEEAECRCLDERDVADAHSDGYEDARLKNYGTRQDV